MDAFALAAQELAKNSPYAVIIVLLMFFFSHIHKNSIQQIKDLHIQSIKEIRGANHDAVVLMQQTTNMVLASKPK